MEHPFVSYYCELELGESSFEEWHPFENNLGRNTLSFVIGVGFKNDIRNTMSLFYFNLDHEKLYREKINSSGVPKWIVTGEFTWSKVYHAIESFVESCSAESKEECFDRLCKRFFWEFDGYKDKVEIAPKNMITFV